MTAFTLAGIPGELTWTTQPVEWSCEGDRLSIVSGPQQDWFIHPVRAVVQTSAPAALFIPPDTAFLLSAQVTVDFNGTFDAGALMVYTADRQWGKLCFEYSPQGQPMVVSVVTKEVSDDCNAVLIDGHTVYLRIAVAPPAVAFHYSRDGVLWHFVRYFRLENVEHPRVGFLSQAPTGAGCRATFAQIRYRAGQLQNNRNGE